MEGISPCNVGLGEGVLDLFIGIDAHSATLHSFHGGQTSGRQSRYAHLGEFRFGSHPGGANFAICTWFGVHAFKIRGQGPGTRLLADCLGWHDACKKKEGLFRE